METECFVIDVRNILYGTSLDEDGRLKLIRNMTLYVLGIELDTLEHSVHRKDSIIREQARGDELAEKRVNDWIDKANLSRYYLSYLRRGLINFIKTGDLNYSALNFRCSEPDICLCYDILKEQGIIEEVRKRILSKEVKPVFLSESSMEYMMKQIEKTIQKNLNDIRFLTNNGVEERSFIETDLRLWAYRVMYLNDGIVDLVYLVNYLKQAVSNHCSNVRDRYLTQKKNSGLIKVNDGVGARAEYSKIVVPLTEELSEYIVARDKIKKDGVPEFVEHINFGDGEKRKLKRFFNIIDGVPDEEFEGYLKFNGYDSQLRNKQGNAYIDTLAQFAIEFIGMGYLMGRIRDSWEVFYDCKNLPSKKYRYMKNLDMILDLQAPTKVKCLLLVKRLKYYPDDFVKFMKMNRKTIEDTPDAEIEKLADTYYGAMNPKELLLYRAANSKIK